MAGPGHRAIDLPARLLEIGLAALVVVVPLPLGAVGPRGRLLLEVGAAALLVLLLARAPFWATPLPSAWARAGVGGLLALAALQSLPLGDAVVSRISPRSVAVRAASEPPAPAQAAEGRILGRPAADFDRRASISLDPGATASALRTGAALAALFIVATAVAALRGARWLALALLLSAAFQGLYGLLVVASGHDRIWYLPKKYFLDNATGTFVNRNHFACLMAMSLACGAALILSEFERQRRTRAGGGLARLLGVDGSRILVLGLLLVVGLAGLLLSFSRAGVATGLFAVGLTIVFAGRRFRRRTRALLVAGILVAALVPLARVGADRLLSRYGLALEEIGSRMVVWSDTLTMAADFPVTGCGYGAFAATYPVYRSGEVRKFFAHAHNDGIQALAEGGVVGVVFLVMAFSPVLAALGPAFAGSKGTIAVGFAAGWVGMLLHSLVDFNFHIPANAATAAVLAGTLLGLPCRRHD